MGLNERLIELKAEQRDLQDSAQKQINDKNTQANALESQAKEIREEAQQIANETNVQLTKIEGKIEEVDAMINAGILSSASNNGSSKEKSKV